MKIFSHILRFILGLLLLMPLLALVGIFPEPTADMYSPGGWAFIEALMNTGYMMPLIQLTSLVCGVLFLLNRTALAAVILTPFTVNVILFHLFLDASPISAAAIPAYILVFGNGFFLWQNRQKYRGLFV